MALAEVSALQMLKHQILYSFLALQSERQFQGSLLCERQFQGNYRIDSDIYSVLLQCFTVFVIVYFLSSLLSTTSNSVFRGIPILLQLYLSRVLCPHCSVEEHHFFSWIYRGWIVMELATISWVLVVERPHRANAGETSVCIPSALYSENSPKGTIWAFGLIHGQWHLKTILCYSQIWVILMCNNLN